MTLPLSTGFPDWTRQASEAQVLEINDNAVSIAHNFQYPAKYVGNARALQLWANPPTHGMRLQAQFYADQAATVIMDSYVVNMLAGDVAKQPVPILGPWTKVVVQHSNAAANTVTIQLWRTPELGRFAGLEGDIALFSKDAQAIGAVSGMTLDHANVMEGPAIWVVGMTGGNWAANITAVDYQGNATELDRTDNTASAFEPRPLYLPPWHIRVNINNFNAAGQTFNLFCTRRHNL